MRSTTIARNYAEALLALAQKAKEVEGWGQMIADVADAMSRDDRLRRFLEAPQISADEKNTVLGKAFADRFPRLFVRFLQQLVKNRRQMLIPEIAIEYGNLLDETLGRLHAQVTVSRETSEADRTAIGDLLTKALGKQVVPHVVVNPAILGGVVVRIGDTVMDGSARRRLLALRQRMTAG
jgi:F-type H+-transporting ATPase subunit delta